MLEDTGMKKFWPFGVTEENEAQLPALYVWLTRAGITALAAGLAGVFFLMKDHF
jgi:hypothetical protein